MYQLDIKKTASWKDACDAKAAWEEAKNSGASLAQQQRAKATYVKLMRKCIHEIG